MPNQVAVRGSSPIAVIAYDHRDPRIYVCSIAEMQAKVRRLFAKYDSPSDFEDRAVEQVLQQAESFADTASDDGVLQ